MTITTRTIISHPTTAAMTAASVFAVSALGLYAMGAFTQDKGCSEQRTRQVAIKRVAAASPCDDVRQSNGLDMASWSERGWFQYASCFAEQNNSRKTVEVSSQALSYYPRSEAIFNLKGYHLVQLREYTEAVHTLRLGLERVGRPTSGTMANNLAWAGLWSPREMKLTEARNHYRAALDTEPGVCETLHTGMWVEYGIYKRNPDAEIFGARLSLKSLISQYIKCRDLNKEGTANAMTEVLGAAVITADLSNHVITDEMPPELVVATNERLGQNKGISIDALCRESIPLATEHHTCIKLLNRFVKYKSNVTPLIY